MKLEPKEKEKIALGCHRILNFHPHYGPTAEDVIRICLEIISIASSNVQRELEETEESKENWLKMFHKYKKEIAPVSQLAEETDSKPV